MSAIEPRPGDVYRTPGGRHLYLVTVNAQTVTYRDGDQGLDSPPLEASRWLFEALIAKRVPQRE